MVTVVQRMRKLKALLAIRIGPGAAVLPKEVKRLHLEFAYKNHDGNMGPRKFWRHCLPRLKYHNPAIPMSVTRHAAAESPSLLTISFTTAPPASPNASPGDPLPSAAGTTIATGSTSGDTAPSKHARVQRTETIDMQHKTDGQILQELLALTGARELRPSPGEMETLRELQEFRERSQRDSARQTEVNAQRRKEAEMLRQARGEVGLST